VQEVYPIKITSEISEEKLLNGTYIFIFRASKIPPHIGIITGGQLFDITTVGPNKGVDVLAFYRTALKRKSEVVFVELFTSNSTLNQTEVITEKVNHYWKVSDDVSCLNPVKDFIETSFNVDVQSSNFIFELLPILYDLELIKNVSQINLDKKISNNIFDIIKYTKLDIENCINALKRKELIC
jgi:hypothetical protein